MNTYTQRTIRQARAIRCYARAYHYPTLDIAALNWVLHGLAEQWAKGNG